MEEYLDTYMKKAYLPKSDIDIEELNTSNECNENSFTTVTLSSAEFVSRFIELYNKEFPHNKIYDKLSKKIYNEFIKIFSYNMCGEYVDKHISLKYILINLMSCLPMHKQNWNSVYKFRDHLINSYEDIDIDDVIYNFDDNGVMFIKIKVKFKKIVK